MDATLMIIWGGVLFAALILVLRSPGRGEESGVAFPNDSVLDIDDDSPPGHSDDE